MDDIPSECRVVPFGNLRIKGYLHLPEAYRSLSRPSSPPRAKASAMRPFLLSLSCLYTVKTTAYGSIYTFSSLLKFYFFVIIMSKIVFPVRFRFLCIRFLGRVENNGFEPLTLCVQGRCSSQLS